VDHDHHRFDHHPHRHRVGGLADHRFFRRRVRDGPLLDDAHSAQSGALPNEIRLKGWRLPIIAITALLFISLSLFLLYQTITNPTSLA
jgi:hypothetical protein